MKAQRGQVMAIVAILSGILIGFVGLVIDVGGIAGDHELAQGAADGAALAAGYQILQANSEATATTYAQAVLTQEGLPSSDLTMRYLDSGGSTTANAALVVTVEAVVSFNHDTRFLPILGVSAVGVSATTQAFVPATTPPCGLCVMPAAGNTITLGKNSKVTVTGGGTVVNSTGNPNVTLNNGSTLTSTFNRLAATNVTGSGTMTPAATVGAAVSDPLPNLAVPGPAGATVAAFSTPSTGSSTISPNEYQGITVNGTYALTLSPGTYIITGPIFMNGGTLTGTNVTLYLACASFPTPCTAGGQAGGDIVVAAGVMTVTAPTSSGTYQGVTIFGDRNNNATNFLAGGSGSFVSTGTIYTELMPWSLAHNNDVYSLNSQLVVAALTTNSGTSLTLNVTAANSAPRQAGGTSTSPPNLSL